MNDRGQGGALILGGRLFGSPLVNGALLENDTTLDIDATTLIGLVAVGDTFTLAGESGSPTHTVTGGPFYLTVGNAIASITFSTAIAAGGVADDAAVTFADNRMGEVVSWTLDNSGLELIETTVKGITHKTFRGGLHAFEGSAAALLDYLDTKQGALIDAIATGSPDGTIASLILEVAPSRFLYGGAVLRHFASTSPETGPVVVGFTFRGTGEFLFSIGGALDTFTDSDKNLSAHTPDLGFGGWTYSGAANEWTIKSNKANKTLTDNDTQFCRSDNDIADDDFEVFADYTRSSGGDFAGEREGLYLLAHKSTAIANGEGVEVVFVRSGPGTVNFRIIRRDSSGVEQQNVLLASITITTGNSLRIGATVSGLEVQGWTEPAGGGTRTNRGSVVTLTADLRDGDHKRIGLTGRSESSSPGPTMDNLEVILNP